MTLKKRIASTLAVGTIAIGAMLAAPVAANATYNPAKLDRGDFTIACREQNDNTLGWVANLRGSTAYSWRCEYVPGGKASTGLSVNQYCMGRTGASGLLRLSQATHTPGSARATRSNTPGRLRDGRGIPLNLIVLNNRWIGYF